MCKPISENYFKKNSNYIVLKKNFFSIDCLLSTDVRTPSLFFCRFHNARLIHLLVYEVGISQKKKKNWS